MLLSSSSDYNGKVVEVQNFLMARGYALPQYGADGYYGSETENAIVKFQNDNALTPSGNVDDATFALLKGSAAGVTQVNQTTVSSNNIFDKVKGMIPTMSTKNITVAAAGVLALMLYLKKRKKVRR